MGSSLVETWSHRVSLCQSVASGFQCLVNRAGLKTVYATHVATSGNFSAWIKNVCAGKLSKLGASFTSQDTAARNEEGAEAQRRKKESKIKCTKVNIFYLKTCFVQFPPPILHILILKGNRCHVRQTDGATQTVMRDLHHPRSPHWNQFVVCGNYHHNLDDETRSHFQGKT